MIFNNIGRKRGIPNTHLTHGDWIFEKDEAGHWYDPKTGKKCQTYSLEELIELLEIDKKHSCNECKNIK